MKMQSAPPSRAASNRDSGFSSPARTSGELVPCEKANISVDWVFGSMIRRIRSAFPVDIGPPISLACVRCVGRCALGAPTTTALPYRFRPTRVKCPWIRIAIGRGATDRACL